MMPHHVTPWLSSDFRKDSIKGGWKRTPLVPRKGVGWAIWGGLVRPPVLGLQWSSVVIRHSSATSELDIRPKCKMPYQSITPKQQ